MSLCWTSWSWEMSCCCCIWSWWKAGELLALSDWSKWVCWTKLTCSCSWSWGTSCSSCFLPASAPCWTSCCSWEGLRLEKGELWRSWCICCSPGGSRGSWRGFTGDNLPDSDSLVFKGYLSSKVSKKLLILTNQSPCLGLVCWLSLHCVFLSKIQYCRSEIMRGWNVLRFKTIGNGIESIPGLFCENERLL